MVTRGALVAGDGFLAQALPRTEPAENDVLLDRAGNLVGLVDRVLVDGPASLSF